MVFVVPHGHFERSDPHGSANETHPATLFATVRENLMFACKTYGPCMPHAKCESRVDEVISSLGLDSCQHTKVRIKGSVLCS